YVTPYEIRGLSWDRWSPGGPYLWAYYNTQDSMIKAIRLNPNTGGATGVEFEGVNLSGDPADPDIPAGIAITRNWEENKLVAVALNQSNTLPGDGNDKIVVYDLATTPPPRWFELLEPSFGTTGPLDSDTMFVRLKAIMEDTLMTAQVVISSNDVVNPEITIPVNFTMLPLIFTGIDEAARQDDAIIYNMFPNPATSELNIALSQSDTVVTIRIFNSTGMLIESIKGASGELIRMDISGLPAGFYQVVVQDKEQVDHRKLLIR
ncbi:MAG: T9SS type A sorting domain-containing protein, partial [Bacteroidales bacterium]